MSFDLPPGLYNGFQKLLHGEYEHTGNLLDGMKAKYPGRALELGCGTGILSRFFEPGMYAGVDLDSGRIELAKQLHPGHEFVSGDVTTIDPLWLAEFGFVFCYGVLHHINDSGVTKIMAAFDRAAEASGKTIHFLAMEPVFPEKTLLNIPGFIIGHLDRGEHMRKVSRLKPLLGKRIAKYEYVPGAWYWPIPGATIVLEFRPGFGEVASASQQVATSRAST